VIITKTPYRVSFFGGGTDYPEWFQENGGAVLATSIGYYCYIHGRVLPQFFEYKHRVVWSKIESVNKFDEIEHPVVREALKWMEIDYGIEIHHSGDLPARSGLGSSSSFSVGILHMLHALKGRLSSKEQLAKDAIYLEQVLLKECVGVQDQITAAYGGFNRIDIKSRGNFSVQPLPISGNVIKNFEERILMFYTGISRYASEVAKEKVNAIHKKNPELNEIRKLVDTATDLLSSGNDLDDFGRLLHETWQLKRSLSASIAPSFVDEIYLKARHAGALGGKLLGAGGGGFMIFYVQPERKQSVVDALDELLLVPFKMDYTGTELMHFNS